MAESLTDLAQRLKPLVIGWINDASGITTGGSIETGVSDHGELLGLADDDHAQYLLDDSSTAGDGLTIGSRVLAVGAGTGLASRRIPSR